MREIIKHLNKKNISNKDVVIYLYIERYPYKTAQQISNILGCDYSRVFETLHKLLQLDLINKTPEKPSRYEVKKNE